ncbi:Supervillin [Larimichthys crocea]|uniref:Uncharacterized protein n=1 Tax=Larimichthys crocea TaxID=215358 RepID=A0ACD3R859_LARCR|nr:Supervillin [Larimichthys crocea]
MENPVLEPRSERIAHYKAERRRELAERYGNMEELPTKWVRRDGKEMQDPATQAHGGTLNSDGLDERVNGRTRGVTNGLDAESADFSYLRRQGSQDSASMLSGEGYHVPIGLDAPQLHTRVSVGQLRSALLQQTGNGAQPEKVCPATSSLDLAVKPGSEGGRRRTRRYLPGGSGGGRKTSERFRTQPITANEMEESSGLLDAEEEENCKADVKTDDRAKMSVAAKMSLFKELEKSAAPEASALLKPRSGSVCHERRVRRGNDHRFLTQPITCEEIVAISAPKPAPSVESQSVQAEPVEDGDESCKLSMSEKLALFNKLSLPGSQGAGPADGPPERRRQKGARYRTQPITVEEVSLLQKGPGTASCLLFVRSSVRQTAGLVCQPKTQQQTEAESVRKMNEDTTVRGYVQVTLVDDTVKLQAANNTSRSQEETDNVERVSPQCWEPVFASVFSSSTPQYIMCFNQTSLSFEAQEVSSPTKTQPQWRQKTGIEDELQTDNAEEMNSQQERNEQETGRMAKRGLGSPESDRNDASHNKRQSTEAATCEGVCSTEFSVRSVMVFEASQSSTLSAASCEVKEATTVVESNTFDGGFYRDQSPPSACCTSTLWRGCCHRERAGPGHHLPDQHTHASELASSIQSQRDLGCHASQIVQLEEGLNCDSSLAADFWSRLGGRAQYRGASAEEEDELFERGVVESNCVYRLVDNRLVPLEQAWASIPSISLLGSSEV